MGGAPEIPRLNSRVIESGGAAPLAVVSGTNPGHTSLVLSNKLTRNRSKNFSINRSGSPCLRSLPSIARSFAAISKPEKNIDLDNVPWRFVSVEGGNMIAALLTDQIDGFLHSEPTTTLAIIE